MNGQELVERVGEHIRACRVGRGWTQSELGERVGNQTKSTVSRWETATSSISLSDLLAVAQAFGQPLAAFLPRGAR